MTEKKEKITEEKAKKMMEQALTGKYQNKLGEALVLLQELNKMLLGEDPKWTKLLYAETVHQRGVVLGMDKNWAGAYESLMDAVFMRKLMNDWIGVAYSMLQLAMLKLEQTGSEEEVLPEFLIAEEYVCLALRIAKDRGDKKALGILTHNNAFIDQIQKQHEKALNGYGEALRYRDGRDKAVTLARIAECYLALGETEQAEDSANDALRYFIKIKDVKRTEQVQKTKKAIKIKNAEKRELLIKELNELYAKATTEENYQNCIKKAGEIFNLMPLIRYVDEDEMLLKVINVWWAIYHSLQKFEKDEKAKKQFVKELESKYSEIKNDELKIKFGYLCSVASANLIGEANRAGEINQEIKTLAEKSGNVSLILREITSRGLKEMAEKNWREAVKIFSEIDSFPTETLLKQENLLHTGNITNNRGASLIRGNINPIAGAINLIKAAEYYSQMEQPPAKHFESKGLPGRLQESLDKLLSSESAIINPSKEIVALIGEAKIILLPVSDKIKEAQTSREYFDTLILKIEKIRKKITDLANKQPINI